MPDRAEKGSGPEFVFYAPYSRFRETQHRTPWLMFPRSFAALGFDATLICGRMEHAPDRAGLRIVETGIVSSDRPVRRFVQALLEPLLAFVTIGKRVPSIVMVGPMGPPLFTTIPLIWIYRHLPGDPRRKRTRFVLKTDADLHNYGIGPKGARLMDLLLVASTHSFDIVTAETICSYDRARTLPGIRSEALLRLPNGFPQGQIGHRTYDTPAGRRKSVLCVARLVPTKGQDVLLRAFARLAVEFPDWTVRIVGDRLHEAYATRLEEMARTPPLVGRVSFGGFRPGAEVDEEYEGSAIFCLPTLLESAGNVKYEATVLGVPVVTTDVPCAAESIAAGWRVARAGDPEQLAERLRELMGSEELRRRTVAVSQSRIRSYVDRAREILVAVGLRGSGSSSDR